MIRRTISWSTVFVSQMGRSVWREPVDFPLPLGVRTASKIRAEFVEELAGI